MSIKRSFNFLPQQRVDLSHLKQIESGITNDFDTLAQGLVGDKSYVVSGLTILNPSASVPAYLQIQAGGSVVWHKTGTEAGTFYTIESSEGVQALAVTNSRVSGSFSAGTNYIGLDFEKSPDPATNDYMKFISRDTDTEYTEVVPLGRVLQYQIIISSQPFSRQSTVCPIAKVVVTNGSVTSVTDCRDMLFRLGKGGDLPDSLASYEWGNREEKGNSFFIGTEDKEISTLKEWMDAVTTSLWELRGGEAWFSPVNRDNVKLAYGSIVQPNQDNFEFNASDADLGWSRSGTTVTVSWPGHTLVANSSIKVINSDDPLAVPNQVYSVVSVTPGVSFVITGLNAGAISGELNLDSTLSWSGLSLLFENSTVYYNPINPGSAVLADGECLFVDVDRGSTAALTPQVESLLTLNLSTIPGKRIVLAWRYGNEVYTRDRAYEAGRSYAFFPAEPEVLGAARISRNASGTDSVAASTNLSPVVISVHGGTIEATGTNKTGLQSTGIGTGSGIKGIGGGTYASGDDGAGIVGVSTFGDGLRVSTSANGKTAIYANKTGTGGSGAYIRANISGGTGIDVAANDYGIKCAANTIGGWFNSSGEGIRTESNGTGILSLAASLGTGGEFYGGNRNPGTAFDITGLSSTYLSAYPQEFLPDGAPAWEKNGLVSVAGLGDIHGIITAGSGTGSGIEGWGGTDGGIGGVFYGGTTGIGVKGIGGGSYWSGNDGVGIFGEATVNDGVRGSTTGTGKSGVWGQSSGNNGYGGYFIASGNTGTGVYGAGEGGVGVFGEGTGNTSTTGVKGKGADATGAFYSGDGMWAIGGVGTVSSLGGGHGIQASGGVGPGGVGGSGGAFYGAGRKPGISGYTNAQTQATTDGPWIGTGIIAVAGIGNKRGIEAYGSGTGPGIEVWGGTGVANGIVAWGSGTGAASVKGMGNANGVSYGVLGDAGGSGAIGVQGTSATGYGVRGDVSGNGSGPTFDYGSDPVGVLGICNGAYSAGVAGVATGTGSYGVFGQGVWYGVWGKSIMTGVFEGLVGAGITGVTDTNPNNPSFPVLASGGFFEGGAGQSSGSSFYAGCPGVPGSRHYGGGGGKGYDVTGGNGTDGGAGAHGGIFKGGGGGRGGDTTGTFTTSGSGGAAGAAISVFSSLGGSPGDFSGGGASPGLTGKRGAHIHFANHIDINAPAIAPTNEAYLYFDGSNLKLVIGSSTYTIQKV